MSATSQVSCAPRRRCRGDDGAVIVEFALAAPILVMLFSGVVDYGFAYRQANQMEGAVLVAGRVVSQQAKARLADFSATQALSSGLSSLRNTTVHRAIIWKVAAGDTKPVPPANCLTVNVDIGLPWAVRGVSGVCNVYTAYQINVSNLSGFPSGASGSVTCPATAWDSNWCPLGRVNTDGSGDFVGVWVEIRTTALTRMIPGGSLTMSRGVVYRLEPPYIGG